ncbi:MAG: DUF4097 family beta strand repeat protein [Gemmatimonadales bacterium]|nr:DUF4097 family beta strand repeat protein [Gemmatimonadota bacterium]MBK7784695.1 DUF4097 family beta strand repeat protein [Gemmatimonadota bacterium]MBP6669761.1 DUF4097 family beta strand repeat protein [Gemmatimonadales bacterium]
MRSLMFALALPALAALPLGAQDFRWQGALASGRTLEVRGINGRIRATRADGAQALVTATKRAKDDDPDSVEIKVVEHAGGVTICAVYPSRRGGRANECRPGGGAMNTRDNDVEVLFEVQVPAGVHFEGSNVNGDVTGESLPADAAISTVNGDVTVSAAGMVEASTVNGSIDASLGSRVLERSVKFTTVNGGITVTLPPGASADVEASTVNGAIDTDFPINVTGRVNPRSLRGRIGEGGRTLELTTVNGGIRIRRGR